MKAFAYLRVSSLGQREGDGYDRQLAACESYCAQDGLEIAEVFRESMTGASDLEDRPALAELLVALEENGVKTVVIEKLDRLARDLLVQENIVRDLAGRGYRLISALEPDLCSTDPSRVLMRQIFGAIAQYDKTMLVAKMRAARERIRGRGERCEGIRPYGELAGEQSVLSKMRAWRQDGRTLQWITDALNLEQVPARGGNAWTVGSVGRILAR
jgi:DNA invertase Pin-like site-specific DNA recombinase